MNDEQRLLLEAVASWSESQASDARKWIRERIVERDSRAARDAQIADLGWSGITIPERFGGAEFGFTGLGLVLEQLGRHLIPSQLVGNAVVAAALLDAGSDDQKERWLPAIASGSASATLALEEQGRHSPNAVRLRAIRDSTGWILEGIKSHVLHGYSAELLLVPAMEVPAPGHGQCSLFLVDAGTPGIERTELQEIERRGAARLAFNAVRIPDTARLGASTGGQELLDLALDHARILQSAEMLGAAEQAFEVTLEYLRTRTQFGQVIGSFQALQHRAAHLAGELELCRAVVEDALAGLDARAPDLALRASHAKAFAGEAFRLAATEMVQLHGGIGMTHEHDAGLYLKRATLNNMDWGSSAFHRERYGSIAGY